MKKDDYEFYKCSIPPAYTYIEGESEEHYWLDLQNADYYMMNDSDKETGLIEGKKWWLMTAYKPKGTTITEENVDELIKWFVNDSYDFADVGKEWDFEKHCPKNE